MLRIFLLICLLVNISFSAQADEFEEIRKQFGDSEDYGQVAETYDEEMANIDPLLMNVPLLSIKEMKKYDANPDMVTDPELQFRMGVSYYYGKVGVGGEDSIPADLDKTISWYKRAVEGKYAKAMVALARIYRDKKNTSRALQLFKRATEVKENPEPYAFYEMGIIYEEGKGRFPNTERALGYYKKAADLGVIQAHIKLADWYIRGYYVDQDFEAAIEHYKEVADMSKDDEVRGEVLVKISEIYGWLATSKNDKPEEMFKWLLIAAEAGNVDSYVRVAHAYQEGKGVERSMEKAISWYKKAAKVGNVIAMNSLGYIYTNGMYNIDEDYCEAKKWYLEAAELGSKDASWNLGNFYLNGFCVKKDRHQAYQWFSRSGQVGDR